jgi:protein-tyrosine phosphatase
MAEALFKQALIDSDLNEVKVKSAGLEALVDHPADQAAQRLMIERGLDISIHRARQLESKLLFWSDLVLVMENAHKVLITSRWPSARGKVYRLGEWGGFDVPDPYRQRDEVFERALHLIAKGVDDWMLKIGQGAKQ